jgi:hypothetical protein
MAGAYFLFRQYRERFTVKNRESRPAPTSTSDAGAPLSAGRFSVNGQRWHAIVANLDKPAIYRISNSSPQASTDDGNVLLVRSGEPPRIVAVAPKNSIDVQAKAVTVRAKGRDSEVATGWYELVSG